MQLTGFAFVLSAVVGQAFAVCPGFNYGIGDVQPLGSGFNRCQSLPFPSMHDNTDGYSGVGDIRERLR